MSEITMGVNTLDFCSGPAMVSTPAMDAGDSITALWITMLPAVRAVISRPSRIDTPDEMRVPSVRVKRDTPACTSGPLRAVQRGHEDVPVALYELPPGGRPGLGDSLDRPTRRYESLGHDVGHLVHPC